MVDTALFLRRCRRRVVGSAPAAPGGTITVANFARDRVIYDSGAAFGLDYAAIPVFISTSLPNQQVEARVVSTDDGGATSGLWVDMGLTSGVGTLAGSLTAVLNRSYYKIEARLKLAPATTSITTNRFGVGHNLAVWGQSEPANAWSVALSGHAAEALLTVRQQVERLATIAGACGRTSLNPLKVVGVDALPSGASIAGRIVTVTGTGTLRDWSFTDYQIQTSGGANWRIEQCVANNPAANVITWQFLAKPGGRLRIDRVTYIGPASEAGVGAVFAEEENGSGYGRITATRCHLTGMTTDAAKLAAGSVRWSYLKWKKNIAVVPTVWSSGTTYAAGDYVTVNQGGAGWVVHKSKVAGNLNNPPPSAAGTSDTFWLAINPHGDCVTFTAAYEPAAVEYCYLDFSELTIANGGTGANNYIRWQNDTGLGAAGFAGNSRVRYNVMDRAATSEQGTFPFHMTASFLGNALIEGNWIRPRHSDDATLFGIGTVIGARITWAGNTRINTGAALATPANCVTGSFTLETNDARVQMVFHDRAVIGSGAAGVTHKFISDASPHTAAFAAMANAFIAERPGEFVCVAHCTQGGTGFTELFKDATSARSWDDDKAVHDYVCTDGATIGVAASSWYASPGALAADYGQAFFELVAGTKLDGSSLGTPRTIVAGTGGAFTIDDAWADIYSYGQTKWVLFGPHRFEDESDLLDATHAAGGAANAKLANIQACRLSNRTMLANSAATMFLPKPFDPLNYQSGRSNGAGGWTDSAHPNYTQPDGLARYMRLHAHAIMQAAGMTQYPVPKFDTCQWQADGSYVEVWSSAGPVTTTRLVRGTTALDNSFPHWTDVFGWQINGIPANRAEIVAGKVRIYPNSGAFISSDVVMFGEGGATGHIQWPEDPVNLAWQNTPIVANAAYGVEGFAVSAMPLATDLANTIVGAPFFTRVSGQAVKLKDTVNWPTSGGQATFALDFKLVNNAATQFLMEIGNAHVTLDASSGGAIRLGIRDSANTALLSSVSIGTLTYGARTEIIIAIDLATNTCITTVQGVPTTRTLPANSGNLSSASRKLNFVARDGDTNRCEGDFYKFEAWTEFAAGGGRPATDTNLRANGRIIGPAAVANAHAWKTGAGSFT